VSAPDAYRTRYAEFVEAIRMDSAPPLAAGMVSMLMPCITLRRMGIERR